MTRAPPTLSVNGRRRTLSDVPDSERLLDTLRERWGLTGTKEGCRSGSCGACTVLVDGEATLSCLALTRELDGTRVLTIEGAEKDPIGRVVQRAFAEQGALQCGYCTPGFVLALTGLIKEGGPDGEDGRFLEDLGGNLCRCTGYASIVRAARVAREATR